MLVWRVLRHAERLTPCTGLCVFQGFLGFSQLLLTCLCWDGLCALLLIPNSEIETLRSGISHQAQALHSSVLNADDLLMCERTACPEMRRFTHGARGLLLQLCGVQMRSAPRPASDVCRPAAEKSPRQPGTGRGGMHAGWSKAVLIKIKL